jgi:hypothetical protein
MDSATGLSMDAPKPLDGPKQDQPADGMHEAGQQRAHAKNNQADLEGELAAEAV